MTKTFWFLLFGLLVAVHATATPIDPRTVYAPTPDWTPPPLDIDPTPNQQRDWTPPVPCDPRNPYWTVDCWTDAVPPAPVVAPQQDDELQRYADYAEPVPEPGLFALVALGGAAALRRRR